MKALMMTALLAIGFSSNLLAQDKKCYPLAANQDGFNRICIEIENPRSENTNAVIELYRVEKLVKKVAGQRVHTPQERVCTPDHGCYRKYEALVVSSNNPDFNLEVHMRVHKSSICLSGNVAIKEQARWIELDVECIDPSWRN